MTLRERISRFAYSQKFENFIIGVIIVNALIIGVQTYYDAYWFSLLDKICVAIFIVEIALKFTGRKSTRAYFRDGWNWFDIIVVAGALIPATGGFSTAARILRVFRILRIIRFIPELRLITGVLVRSLKSMTYIALLMFIISYIYAIIGWKLFGNYMFEYATLHEAFFSLFRSLTLEDWTDLRYDGLDYGNYWVVTAYHVSWIVISTFVMLNLVVGAIINNYNLVQEEEAKRQRALHPELAVRDDERLKELLNELQELLAHRQVRAEEGG